MIIPKKTALSAFISSLASFLITIPAKQRTDIALFAGVRAADRIFTSRLSSNSKNILYTAAFQLSCWQIMYAWFYYPETLPKSYNQWISRLAHMDFRVLRALKENKNGGLKSYGETLLLPKDLAEYAANFGLDPNYRGYLPCRIAHGGIDGCVNHTVDVFKNGAIDAAKIYLPLNTLMLILNLKKLSRKKVRNAIKATLRSCLFLASFISIIWGTICIGRKTFNRGDRKSGQLLATFLSGFTVLIETDDRRKQLALYTLPKAIESFLAVRVPAFMKDRCQSFVFPMQTLLFSSSLSYLLSRYRNTDNSNEKTLINSIFKFFLVDS